MRQGFSPCKNIHSTFPASKESTQKCIKGTLRQRWGIVPFNMVPIDRQSCTHWSQFHIWNIILNKQACSCQWKDTRIGRKAWRQALEERDKFKARKKRGCHTMSQPWFDIPLTLGCWKPVWGDLGKDNDRGWNWTSNLQLYMSVL